MPTDGPTLDQMTDESEVVTAARQIVADLKLWADGELPWDECVHSLLLYGKPTTGKTYLARAIGRTSGVPIFMSSLARWQSCGHLGEMLKAMISTFNEAIAAAPSIVFVDEIDSAGSRESNKQQNSSYRRQIINGCWNKSMSLCEVFILKRVKMQKICV
jgi:AAA+ superfamily predicted ATPase